MLGSLKVLRLSPLAIGIGIYLPMDATQPVVVGALIGWFYDRAMNRRGNAEMAKRFGVLLASGLIVGESLLGVLNAGLIVATGYGGAARPWSARALPARRNGWGSCCSRQSSRSAIGGSRDNRSWSRCLPEGDPR